MEFARETCGGGNGNCPRDVAGRCTKMRDEKWKEEYCNVNKKEDTNMWFGGK